ncbi:MAG: hypothetical protein J6A61_05020 [Clostridia bacterium]|nr:hypothetical protein [Clostridia bacterium]
MKKIFNIIILVIVCIIITVVSYDFFFLNLKIEIEDIYIDNPYLNTLSNYDIMEEYSDTIHTTDDVKVVYVNCRIYNTSFLKTYQFIEPQFTSRDDLYPFVGEGWDIRYNPIKQLDPGHLYSTACITAVVDKNVSDDEIIRLISEKSINLRGSIRLFGIGLYRSDRVSNSILLEIEGR